MFPQFTKLWHEACICDLFACIFTQGTLVYSLIWRTLCSVCTEFDSGEISGSTPPTLLRRGRKQILPPVGQQRHPLVIIKQSNIQNYYCKSATWETVCPLAEAELWMSRTNLEAVLQYLYDRQVSVVHWTDIIMFKLLFAVSAQIWAYGVLEALQYIYFNWPFP